MCTMSPSFAVVSTACCVITNENNEKNTHRRPAETNQPTRSGDIADLYASDEKDAIRNGVRSGCKGAGIQDGDIGGGGEDAKGEKPFWAGKTKRSYLRSPGIKPRYCAIEVAPSTLNQMFCCWISQGNNRDSSHEHSKCVKTGIPGCI